MYDKVGNLVDDDQEYEYVYDAWGRLRKVLDQSSGLVAEYTYNGLGHRVGWHYDVDADATVENTSDDPWFFFAYDDMWRVVATYHEDDDPDAVPEEKPKEVFVYHAAGLDGAGGSSYIDSVILRERDANTDWDTASDGVLEERLYYCQNWRADVVVLMTVNGDVAEFVKYSAYGEPFLIPAGDVNSTGATDGQDLTDFGNVLNATYPYDVRCDLTFDGTIDSADYFNFGAHYSAGYNSGRGEVSRYDLASRKAYAGYENDGNLTRFYHVRFRVLDTLLGRWTRRDPLGYVDGANLYGYAGGRPVVGRDADGRACTLASGDCGSFGGGRIPPIWLPPDYPCCLTACDHVDPVTGRPPMGRAICCRGRQIICNCFAQRPIQPGWEDVQEQIRRCINQCESEHFPHYKCTPGLPYEGAPPSTWPCGKVCGEAAVYRCMARCMRSLPCDDSPNPELCRAMIRDAEDGRDHWQGRCSDCGRRRQQDLDRGAPGFPGNGGGTGTQ